MSNIKGYSLKDVAKKVGVSTATIIRWIDIKKVELDKKKNSQNHYIFTETDLQALKAYRRSIKVIKPGKRND